MFEIQSIEYQVLAVLDVIMYCPLIYLQNLSLDCFQVLAVLDVIMPGESRMRGVMLYELHLPNVMLANR